MFVWFLVLHREENQEIYQSIQLKQVKQGTEKVKQPFFVENSTQAKIQDTKISSLGSDRCMGKFHSMHTFIFNYFIILHWNSVHLSFEVHIVWTKVIKYSRLGYTASVWARERKLNRIQLERNFKSHFNFLPRVSCFHSYVFYWSARISILYALCALLYANSLHSAWSARSLTKIHDIENDEESVYTILNVLCFVGYFTSANDFREKIPIGHINIRPVLCTVWLIADSDHFVILLSPTLNI